MPNENEPQPSSDSELGEAGKRAIAAERTRADNAERALADATRKLQAYTDAGITDPAAVKAELDRLTAENTDLTTTNGNLTGENRRLNVGLDKGLPKALISRLQGDDEDALNADADALLAFVPAGSTPAPRADPSQGPKATTGVQKPEDEFSNFLNQQLGGTPK